jgi:hypothetical protein
VYYLSYAHPSLKNWWVVYKINPEMHTHRYDEYNERHEGDTIDVYKEQIEGHQSFTVSDGAELSELVIRDVDLMEEEESGPSKKHLQKSQRIIENAKRCKQLDAYVTKADSDAYDL